MKFTVLSQLSDCSPETKFFLLRFCMSNAYTLPDILQVDDIAKTLIMNRSLTGKALQELTQTGYLSVSPIAQTGKGRPKNLYDVTAKMSAMLETGDSKSTLHQDLIDDLIAPDKSSDSGERRHPLKTPTRLLLATLLALSDEKGVARDARTSELCANTGMGPDRIRNHVAKLCKLGYIRRVIPGVSSSKLFGTVGSAYILNLRHDSYREFAYSGSLWLISLVDEQNRQLPFEAYRLIKLARSAGNDSLQSLGRTQRGLEDLRVNLDPRTFHSIAPRLVETQPYRLAQRLQFELEIAASAILSLMGNDLSSDSIAIDDQIQEEYLGTTVTPKKLFEEQSASRSSLLSVLYHLAWHMAKDRYGIIGISENPKRNYFLHHPSGTPNPMTGLPGSRHFAVESLEKANKRSNVVQIVFNPFEPNSALRKELREDSLENTARRRFGLGEKPGP